MTDIEPTRDEMKFRLFVSVLGIALILLGVALRGLPAEAQLQQLLLLAFAFLAGSAVLSAAKLRRLTDE